MAKLKITTSGTYTVTHKTTVEVDANSPVTAVLNGGGGNIRKLTVDFENASQADTVVVNLSSFTGGPLTLKLKGYNSVDQLQLNGATIVGVDPNNPKNLIFNYTGADGQTYTGKAVLKGGNRNWNNNPLVVCFAEGTLILTPHGEVPVEDLCTGDVVRSWDGDDCPILWIGRRRVGPMELAIKPALAPIRLAAGVLGPGKPSRDLFVSPQHRIVLEGPRIELLFGEPRILAPAVSLASGEDVRPASSVTYYHILLADHRVLSANGAPAESLLLGPGSIEAINDAQRAEIAAMFPTLRTPRIDRQRACLPVLRTREARLAAYELGICGGADSHWAGVAA